MNSTIKIDYLDRGTGKGLEPVITVKISQTDDPRDKLLKALFESLQEGCFLQVWHNNMDVFRNDKGQWIQEGDKNLILFNPDIEIDYENILKKEEEKKKEEILKTKATYKKN